MDVVTLGETMVLFTPDSTGAMRYAHQYTRKFGGAETNVAIGLSRLGHQSGWISKVGDDEFGRAMLSFVRGEGVDVDHVHIDDTAPTGIYFKEKVREDYINVYYYRHGSAASKLTAADVNEEYVAQSRYLFLSGITPALSEGCREAVFQAIEYAKQHHVTVVFDPNLRKKLWPEAEARQVLTEIASQVDMMLLGKSEAAFLYGESDVEQVGQMLIDQGKELVVVKLGSAGAYYISKHEAAYVSPYKVGQVVDPVGAGDAFNAGVLSGLLDGLPLSKTIQRANAMGAMVTMVNGDVEGLPERRELSHFIAGSAEDVIR